MCNMRGRGSQVSEGHVIDMLWKKTGALYEFAGRAGAAIALNDADRDIPEVNALAEFCSLCGTAFQIQDDILGVVGDEAQLGKPVGSDIREGKSTLLILRALERADAGQRARLLAQLGNADASDHDMNATINLLRELQVVEYAQGIARRTVDQALDQLRPLPDNPYKRLLQSWAHYLIQRQF